MSKDDLAKLFEKHQHYIDYIVEHFIQDHPTFRHMKEDWQSECYLWFCERANDYEPDPNNGEAASFTTWLHSQLTGRLNNLMKKSIRDAQREQEYIEAHGDALLETQPERSPEFESLLDGLTEKQMHVLRCLYEEGKTVAEVGEELGISYQAVQRIRDRAMGSIKKSIT